MAFLQAGSRLRSSEVHSNDFNKYRSSAVTEAGKIFELRKRIHKSLEKYDFVMKEYSNKIDLFLCLFFLWNSLANLYLYLSPSFQNEVVVLSPEQQRLLKIDPKDKSFVVKKQLIEQPQTPTSRGPPSWPKRRQPSRTTSSGTLVQDTTPERCSSSYSPGLVADGRGLGSHMSQSPTTKVLNRSFETTPTRGTVKKASSSSSSILGLHHSPGRSPGRSPVNPEDQITDADSLSRYLKTQEEKDAITRRAQFEGSWSTSFWNYGRGALDFLPSFGIYQLATRSPQSSGQNSDDVNQVFEYETMRRQLNIGKAELDFWTENLRKWIAETILEKLIAEIKTINDSLAQNGITELKIGSVSVNSLRNVALTKSHLVPSLKSVIPYLDITANQEYLIKRLDDLSTGGCLRLYKWDSGGLHKGKNWDQELPTDAQIIAHLFCTYMDTHLPSNPRYQDGNSFSGLHFLKPPSKPSDRRSDLCILHTRTHPPHFKVVEAEETHDIPRGRHNLFMAISVFLYLVKTKNHGMLERVNLGPSGLNILWILNKR
eukprot:gene2425-18078_t